MKCLVISDIHGNLPALQAVFDDADGEYDTIVCLGDILGIVPYNDHVLEKIRGETPFVVYGNHDARFRDEYANTVRREVEEKEREIVENQLSGRQLSWIQSLPDRINTPEFVLAHSWPFLFNDQPSSTTGYLHGDGGVHKGDFTRLGPYLDGRFALIGHTHYQAAVNCDEFVGQSGTVVNPGSVGQPFDGDAEYALVDTREQTFELRSTEYESEQIVDRFHEYDISPQLWQKNTPKHQSHVES